MGLFDKLFSGLSKTRKNMVELEALFQDYAPDDESFYEDLEELLVMADVGAATAQQVDYLMHKATWVERYRKGSEARDGLIRVLKKLLDVGDTSLKLNTKPSVILMVGVNGVGKTTTIGKLAHQLKDEGKKVLLIKDSCSLVVIPYLSLCFSEMRTYDMRIEDAPLDAVIEAFRPDLVMVLYNPGALEDNNWNMFYFS